MTINDEITILANQLANAGNKPTVALIKAKLNKKIPLPIIISTLKVWQHEPNFISKPIEKHDITEEKNTVEETDNFRQKLNEELAQIKQEIIELKQMIKQLVEQKKS
ncbi:MAG: hypothetical protein COB45_08660 [Gammaproteobacteria bacterium]|nr:MAG: hypothetical protein COB45_08660 [Gammaproteobacteria bacterium]PHR85497.1 MAG: hypothetical protein COA59_00625 [Colwellia sp.]